MVERAKEEGKGEKTDSSLKPAEGAWPGQHRGFGPEKCVSDFGQSEG